MLKDEVFQSCRMRNDEDLNDESCMSLVDKPYENAFDLEFLRAKNSSSGAVAESFGIELMAPHRSSA